MRFGSPDIALHAGVRFGGNYFVVIVGKFAVVPRGHEAVPDPSSVFSIFCCDISSLPPSYHVALDCGYQVDKFELLSTYGLLIR
jgi:hypothetical protein